MNTTEMKRLDEAADWMLRLQDDGTGTETLADWVKWCETDERNQASFDRVQELWQLSQGLAQEVEGGELKSASFPARRALRYGKWLWPVAAALVLTIGTVLWAKFLHVANNSLIASPESVHRAILPDGSRVELAAKSTVAVHYTGSARVLELKDGEAYFSVKPNKERPFIVETANVRVRAIGTAFNLRRAGQRIVVTVTEGLVEVDRVGSSDRVRLAAGRQLTLTPEGRMPAAAGADPAAALAWREGRLEYVGEPLEAVVADINRYAKRPVVIGDEAAKRLRFSGTVMIALTNEWVRALPGEFPVRVQEQNGVDVIQSVP